MVVLDFLREKGKAPMRLAPYPNPSPRQAKGLLLPFAGLLMALLAACQAAVQTPSLSPTATPSQAPTNLPAATATAAPTPTATITASPSPNVSAAAEFPRTLTDDDGTKITLSSEPQKIISLAPSFTEIVFALGAGARLVGGTDYDDYPPEAIPLPDVATYNGVVTEKVVALQPDLVLAGGNGLTKQADIDRLRQLGFNVLVTYPPTVSAVLDDIKLIGSAIGEDQAAVAMTNTMQQNIDATSQAVASLPKPRVFYEIGYQPDIYAPAPDSFVADMVNLAGGNPITTSDPSVFSIPLEQLVVADPQVIVLGDAAYPGGPCPADVAKRSGWGTMTAVKQSEIRPVDDIVVTRPGPRLADGLALLALAIHPDAQVQPPAGAREICGP
jgi:iron complex transport system substrate-binding protein